VGQGLADLGVASIDQIARARREGYDLKMIGIFNARNPRGFAYRVDNLGANPTPEDWVGKTISCSSIEDVEYYRRFFDVHDIDVGTEGKPTEVNFVTMDFRVGMTQMLAGEVDGLTAWYGSLYVLAKLAGAAQGINVNQFFVYDWDWPAYGNSWFTTEELIDEHPELVEGWMRATWRGYEYYANNKDEGIAAMMKHHPELKEEEASLQAVQALYTMQVEEQLANGYGSADMDKLEQTLQLLGPDYWVEPSELYTSEFVFPEFKPPPPPAVPP
jgi:NitT/TauT family transport system substrate-binding protein